jgi:hypothetical protein
LKHALRLSERAMHRLSSHAEPDLAYTISQLDLMTLGQGKCGCPKHHARKKH